METQGKNLNMTHPNIRMMIEKIKYFSMNENEILIKKKKSWANETNTKYIFNSNDKIRAQGTSEKLMAVRLFDYICEVIRLWMFVCIANEMDGIGLILKMNTLFYDSVFSCEHKCSTRRWTSRFHFICMYDVRIHRKQQ